MEEEKKKITAKDILALLRDRYSNGGEWVCASEVQRTTGWSDRRYDFVAMNCWKSNFYKIEVVEIKVSKADLRRELEEPEKHNVMFDDIDYYSLAAPDKIIDMSIIPPKWGVYAVVDGKLVIKRKPLALHDEPRTTLPRAFAASFMRAAAAQNMERTLLADEKKKSFDEGYERGKREYGQMADSWDNYKRIRQENQKLSNLLANLGIFAVDDEKDQCQIARLKRIGEIVSKMEVSQLHWVMSALKKSIADIEEAFVSLNHLCNGDGDLTNAPQI